MQRRRNVIVLVFALVLLLVSIYAALSTRSTMAGYTAEERGKPNTDTYRVYLSKCPDARCS